MGERWNRKYTKDQVLEAVAKSVSIRQALLYLNLNATGGNYTCFKKLIKQLDIDTSHFLGQGHSKGQKIGPKRPIEDYLSNQFTIQSHKLRLRLIREGYFDSSCQTCNLKTWQKQVIPLELHHIDGNHFNNNLDNLTLLCPNCHALTDTHRGKNKS